MLEHAAAQARLETTKGDGFQVASPRCSGRTDQGQTDEGEGDGREERAGSGREREAGHDEGSPALPEHMVERQSGGRGRHEPEHGPHGHGEQRYLNG
jgi:hypothetical protein